MTHHRVLLFAGLAEVCGCNVIELDLPAASTVGELQNAAAAKLPALRGAIYQVAVDSTYATAETVLPATAEIAFLPPVSGG